MLRSLSRFVIFTVRWLSMYMITGQIAGNHQSVISEYHLGFDVQFGQFALLKGVAIILCLQGLLNFGKITSLEKFKCKKLFFRQSMNLTCGIYNSKLVINLTFYQ